MGARQIGGAVQRNDCLAGTGRAGYASRTGEIVLYYLPLIGVEKDGPLVPRIIEGTLQFLEARDIPKPALSVRMVEGGRRGRSRKAEKLFGQKGRG